jgi:hypothetical protein
MEAARFLGNLTVPSCRLREVRPSTLIADPLIGPDIPVAWTPDAKGPTSRGQGLKLHDIRHGLGLLTAGWRFSRCACLGACFADDKDGAESLLPPSRVWGEKGSSNCAWERPRHLGRCQRLFSLSQKCACLDVTFRAFVRTNDGTCEYWGQEPGPLDLEWESGIRKPALGIASLVLTTNQSSTKGHSNTTAIGRTSGLAAACSQ